MQRVFSSSQAKRYSAKRPLLYFNKFYYTSAPTAECARLKSLLQTCFYSNGGRAIAQAVSRWIPTAAARVRARVWSMGFVVDKVALGQVFSQYFGFPCHSSLHQILYPHNHLGACTIDQKWPTYRVDPVWTPSPTIRIKKLFRWI
jgi:hypothetical protein